MRLDIIMYHYVRDPADTAFRAVPAVTRAVFEKHLDHLASRASFVSASDVIAAARGERDLPERSCLLTFDDGLKEHATVVAPTLAARKISAVFFPIMGFVDTGLVLDTHKTHALLARLGTGPSIEAFHAWVRANVPERFLEWEITDRERKSQSRHDDVLTGNLKATLKALDATTRADFLRDVLMPLVGSEADLSRAWYVSGDDLRTMAGLGMEIGSHGWAHPHLGKMPEDEIRSDVARAKNALHGILGEQTVPMFCYPYGSHAPTTLDVLSEMGYSCAVSVGVGSNTDLSAPLQLKRYDANDVLTL